PLIVLRAFASGSVGLTGSEAIANGVPNFKPPESRNAVITLVWMGAIFGTLFLGITYLATHIGIAPDQSELETVNSMLTRSIVGDGTPSISSSRSRRRSSCCWPRIRALPASRG